MSVARLVPKPNRRALVAALLWLHVHLDLAGLHASATLTVALTPPRPGVRAVDWARLRVAVISLFTVGAALRIDRVRELRMARPLTHPTTAFVTAVRPLCPLGHDAVLIVLAATDHSWGDILCTKHG